MVVSGYPVLTVAQKRKPAPMLKHIPALDGVRGLAIIGVLLAHTRLSDGVGGALGALQSKLIVGGVYGVDLFFVLSGFLITGILLDTRESSSYFRTFYARRVLRIFPVYYLYLFAAVALFPALHRLAKTSIPEFHGSWWWYVLFLSNWSPGRGVSDPCLGHFWSLAVEEQFYLFWSAVVFVIPSRKQLMTVCFFLVTAALCLRIAAALNHADWNTSYRLTPMRFDSLAVGAIGAILYRSSSAASEWLGRNALLLFVTAASLFAGVAVLSGGTGWDHLPIQTIGGTLLAFAFGALVYFAAQPAASAGAGLLNQASLRSFGKYSYAIYVYHAAVWAHLGWLADYLHRRFAGVSYAGLELAAAALTIAISYGLGKVSWALFESPVLKLKEKFRY